MDKEAIELLQKLVKGQEETNKRLDKIETDVKELKTDVKEIDKKIDTLYNAVAEAKEDITEIKNKVDKLENVTRVNCYEIANLKLVK